MTVKILSPVFLNNQPIPSKYTCDGENVNPPLSFLEVPENAKSLVLIVDDPDASTKTWTHQNSLDYMRGPAVTKVSARQKEVI